MRQRITLTALMLAVCIMGMAQGLKSVSILGDSYSTFEGYLEPDTNFVWYWKIPQKQHTDVSSVTQTWWHLFIKENGYKIKLDYGAFPDRPYDSKAVWGNDMKIKK